MRRWTQVSPVLIQSSHTCLFVCLILIWSRWVHACAIKFLLSLLIASATPGGRSSLWYQTSIAMAALLGDQQALGKGPLLVNPLCLAAEAGVARHLENFLAPVLVAALCPDGLAF